MKKQLQEVTKRTLRAYNKVCRQVFSEELERGTPVPDAERLSEMAAKWATGMFKEGELSPKTLAQEAKTARGDIFRKIAAGEVESALA